MNNKRSQRCLLAIGFLLLLSAMPQRSFAQTTAFTYQGKLTDAGNPANGNFDLQFKLFDAVSGGTQIGATVTSNAVAVSGGVFTTTLDFGANAFPGAARWLEISVRPAGGGAFTLLSPRQSLGTVPYAIRSLTAGNAAQLGGVDAARYVQQDASNNVSVGGNLTVSGTFSANIVNVQTQFNLGGQHILSSTFLGNLFVGPGIGAVNTGNYNTFAGVEAGKSNTTGGTNSFFGFSAGYANTTGSFNVYAGYSAGALNTSGSWNTFSGYGAGFNNTASNNAFFGAEAGLNNQTGTANSFFGRAAGNGNLNGTRNSFFGFQAGKANTSGAFNSFFGANAGAQNTTGGANSFFGDGAGTANTTGSSNSFFGGLAGGENTAGQANAFFGQLSGLRNQGNDNTFIGFAAGTNTGISTPLSGGGNTVLGSNAGSTLTTGSNNTLIGYFANLSTNNLNFASAIGAQAVVGSNDTIVLGKAAGTYNSVVRPADTVQIPGSLSIGATILPQAKLYVSGGTSWFQGDSTPLPGVAGKGLAVGFAGEQGYLFAFDYAASTPKNLLLNNPGGNVGIGTTAPGSKLTVAGLIESTAGGIKFPDGTTQTTAATGGGGGILNQTTLQAGANFNIGGTGTANVLNAVTQFNLNGSRVLAGTEGGGNLFAGFNAGASNTFGANNTFVGLSAGLLNANGGDNTFIGAGSGGSNTDGGDNTFVGRSAGAQNSTGAGNAFFGKRAGFGTTTGNLNTFAGWQAGESNVTGEKNVYLGAYTGEFSSTGNNNTFIGTESGRANSNGSNNTFIGYGAQGFVGNNLTNATALGANAAVLQSNSLVLGSINGINNATADTKVGIGTNTPRHKLEVKNGSALVTNGDLIVSAPGQGVVLTAPNGSCFRLTVSNAGVLSTTPITCP